MSKERQNENPNAGSGQSNAQAPNAKQPENQAASAAASPQAVPPIVPPAAPATPTVDPIQVAVAGLREEIREVLTVLAKRISVLEKVTGATDRGVIPSTIRNENTDKGPWPTDARPPDGFREP